MCGILGMGFLQKGDITQDSEGIRRVLRRMLIMSSRRGRDATGVALVSFKKATIIKHHVQARRFVETDLYKNTIDKFLDLSISREDSRSPIMILGHNRHQTKGTYMNKHNNHPILAREIIGVHNGVIGNDDDLFEEYKREPKFKRKARVDSEIIFRLLDHHINTKEVGTIGAIKKASSELRGSYACATVNMRKPWALWLFKAYGPIEVIHYPKSGIIFFASERMFIESSLTAESVDLGRGVDLPFGKQEGMGINLQTNRRTKFELEEPPTAKSAW